jgi:opacity protein-like surface antigen
VRGTLAAAGLLMMTLASPVSGQTSFGVRGYFTYGGVSFSAADSIEAVTGGTRASFVGGGGHVTVWKGLFADVGVASYSLDGQRVFVNNGTVYPLNIPVTLKFLPVDLAVGWRMHGRVQPYGGVGMTSLGYKETGEYAQPGEDVDLRRTGLLVLAGADVTVWRTWLHAGGEIRYRSVKGILGDSGASAAFGEDDAGGVAYALRVSIGR